METSSSQRRIVLDNGTSDLKFGLAGDKTCSAIPSVVGRSRFTNSPLLGNKTSFVGDQVNLMSGMLELNPVFERGIVNNWEYLEQLYRRAFEFQNLTTAGSSVLITEPFQNPVINRENLIQLFFEEFNISAIYIAIQGVLSLYSHGSKTGISVDSGEGITQVLPIYEGYVFPHASYRLDYAGNDVTEYLRRLLTEEGSAFETSAEVEIVKNIKEKHGYCALDFERELNEVQTSISKQETFHLPDGQTIQILSERFRCVETLFQPSFLGLEVEGIHEAIYNSVTLSEIDIRKSLYNNIILSGGNTLFPGFENRLLNELKILAPENMKINISATPDRKNRVWLGGSILASMSTFHSMQATKEFFDEQGAARTAMKFM
jgi:actin